MWLLVPVGLMQCFQILHDMKHMETYFKTQIPRLSSKTFLYIIFGVKPQRWISTKILDYDDTDNLGIIF